MATHMIGKAGLPGAADNALDAFRRRVIDDPGLQERLNAIGRPEDYIAAALDLAGGMGIALTAEAVADAIRPDPLGVGRWGAAPVTLDRWPAAGWLPTRSVPTGEAPAFDWARFDARPLAEPSYEPFYEDSVRRASATPFNQMFRTRTSLEALIQGARDEDVRAPSGFVFHMSRCGSTLVSGMLAAVAHHHVVSEPEPLDAVVQWAGATSAPLPERVAAVRAIVAALGRHRAGEARRFFVKLDSWHTLALPLFRAAFPDVPWLFLYREPLEVAVAQQREPSVQAIAGASLPAGLDLVEDEHLPEDYCALALARVCGAALDHWPGGGGLLVNYAELGAAMTGKIPAHFGFEPDPTEAAAMRGATAGHSKYPGATFVSDGQAKRVAASPTLEAAVDKHLRPVYDRLEAQRRGAA